MFVDLRDRYGMTQLAFDQEGDEGLWCEAKELGREYVISVRGEVEGRKTANAQMETGEVEVRVSELVVLNKSAVPPFTIEDATDGGDELRMKYRYLDLRRGAVRRNLELRHKMCMEVRRYLDGAGFLEVETPVLIKSTPEGARDFVVPSRLHAGQYYALPQSPQTFKQLLMVSGLDRYFQIVKCFRDEDLRADRQPEFTQIDCEMSFVTREDVMTTFEGLVRHLFKEILGRTFAGPFERLTWSEAMRDYGSDKPDMRFGMRIVELTELLAGGEFAGFKDAQYVGGLCARGAGSYTRKQVEELTEFVRRPQTGGLGLVYARVIEEGGEVKVKSSVDKYYSQEQLQELKRAMGGEAGDLLLIMYGTEAMRVRRQLNDLRLELGDRLGLRKSGEYACVWVTDFPLFEWNAEEGRYYAMHHPFTSPLGEDIALLGSETGSVRADAYDMVINGVEVGGGSIRIHDSALQGQIFELLGFTEAEAKEQFGFLMEAFKYGAPPHGGIAYGLDRLVSLFAGLESIRDCIAFPKNNSGRDVMIEAPSRLGASQLSELGLGS